MQRSVRLDKTRLDLRAPPGVIPLESEDGVFALALVLIITTKQPDVGASPFRCPKLEVPVEGSSHECFRGTALQIVPGRDNGLYRRC